jgi:dienelactone hydrolase
MRAGLPEALTPAKLRDGIRLDGLLAELTDASRYELRVNLMAGDRPFAAVRRPLFSATGLQAEVGKLSDELSGTEAAAGRALPELRLLLLRIERLAEKLSAYGDGYGRGKSLLELIGRMRDRLNAHAEGTPPPVPASGLIEGAYVSPVDGSVQPYRLFIPKALAKTAQEEGRAIPLTVLFHGYVPAYTRTSWMRIGPRMQKALGAAGMAMLLTFGRSNTDFLSVGEVDTFDALRDVRRRWPIDPQRLYLTGFSMGGSGVWTTLTHYPGVFAAGRIWSGRTDYYFWHALDRQSLPGYIRFAIDADNPIDLAENLHRTPLIVRHPKNDGLVKWGHTERMQERLQALGHPAPLQIFMPDGGTHWSFSDALENPETYRQLLRYRRDPEPESVQVVSFTPKYGTHAWLRIAEIRTYGKRARARAHVVRDRAAVVVDGLENVAVLSIDPDRLPVEAPPVLGKDGAVAAGEKRFELIVKGGARSNALPDLDGWKRYAIAPPGEDFPEPSPLRKSRELCGPVKEAFNAPFLAVRGTRGGDRTRERIAGAADRFLREWEAFACGRPRVKNDVEVTAGDIRKYNLVCFGSPQSNAVLTAIASRLPFRFDRNGYGVGEFLVRPQGDETLGFVACYPNPAAGNRLVVVMDGLYYGDALPINHKWDLVPDYLVFTGERGPRGTNAPRLAGYFDSSWNVDVSLQYAPSE